MRGCFICKTDQYVKYYCTVDNSDYLECTNCNLIYLDKIAPTQELYKAYDGGTWKSFRRKLLAPMRKFSQYRNYDYAIDRANRIFKFASAYNKNNSTQPVFLDVGCNKGFLLSRAVESGWNIYGVEIVPELMIPFRKKYKQFDDHIFSERFHDVQKKFKDNMFDLITAIDVIEHVEDPIEDLGNIYRMLKPGSSFVIQTPDSECQQAKEEKEKWGALKPLEHLHIFGRKSLGMFSKQLGFKEIQFFEPFEHADGNFVAVMTK